MGSAVRVGPAGWSYPDWEGRVYPRPKPRGFDPLAYLAPFVDLIEINTTFYALPRSRNAERWVQRVAPQPDFRFVAKLHRSFTHEELPATERELGARVEAFQTELEPLRASQRLQALLAQFPYSFSRTGPRGRHVGRLLAYSWHVPLVLEFRHASWFEPTALAAFRRRGVSLATIDLPEAAHHPPKAFEPTGPLGYLRLHGRNAETWFASGVGRDQRYDYLYTEREVDELAGRARRLAGETDETLVATNNHFGGQAVANALEIMSRLRNSRVAVPPALAQAFPRLASIAAPPAPPTRPGGPAGQRDLFEREDAPFGPERS